MKKKDFFVHKTSIVDEKVKIGKGSKIWHWSHISANSRVGKNSIIGQGCFVGNNVKIGNNCKIQNNVSIFDVFVGGDLGENYKSIAINVVLQPTKKTLTDKEIDSLGKKLVANVTSATGGKLRT